MDAHTRYILTALRALLQAALACAPSDALDRALRAALAHTEDALGEPRSHAGRCERRGVLQWREEVRGG